MEPALLIISDYLINRFRNQTDQLLSLLKINAKPYLSENYFSNRGYVFNTLHAFFCGAKNAS